MFSLNTAWTNTSDDVQWFPAQRVTIVTINKQFSWTSWSYHYASVNISLWHWIVKLQTYFPDFCFWTLVRSTFYFLLLQMGTSQMTFHVDLVHIANEKYSFCEGSLHCSICFYQSDEFHSNFLLFCFSGSFASKNGIEIRLIKSAINIFNILPRKT